MFEYKSKLYLNLQEQVLKNKEDIETIVRNSVELAEFGIFVQGIVETVAQLPPDAPEFGYAYLVGATAPRRLYVWTRTLTEGETGAWVDLGEFPRAGTKGDKGEKGDTGDIGPAGPRGPQGERGIPGAAGDSKWNKTVIALFEDLLKNYVMYTRADARPVVDELLATLGGASTLSRIESSWVGMPPRFVGDSISADDFFTSAFYADGTVETIYDFEVNPTVLNSTSNDITITYKGKTYTVKNVPAIAVEPTAAVVLAGPSSFYVGDSYRDGRGWNLRVSYNNGTSIDNYDLNTVDFEPETASLGDTEVTLRLTGTDITTKRAVTVTERPVDQCLVTINNDAGLTWTITSGGSPITSGTYVAAGATLNYSFTLADHYHVAEDNSYELNGDVVEVTESGSVTVAGGDIIFNAASEYDTYLVNIVVSEGASLQVQNVATGADVHSGDELPYATQLMLTKSIAEGYQQDAYVYWSSGQSHTDITTNPAVIYVSGQMTIRLEASLKPTPTDYTYTWTSTIVSGTASGDKTVGVYTASIGQSGSYTGPMTVYNGNTKITEVPDNLNYVHISLNPKPTTGIKGPCDVVVKKVNNQWQCTKMYVNATQNKIDYLSTVPNFYIQDNKLYATTLGGYTQGSVYNLNISSTYRDVNDVVITISSNPDETA